MFYDINNEMKKKQQLTNSLKMNENKTKNLCFNIIILKTIVCVDGNLFLFFFHFISMFVGTILDVKTFVHIIIVCSFIFIINKQNKTKKKVTKIN